MNDKNGQKLEPGDYVRTTERQINGLKTSNIAIVSIVEPSVTTILFNNNGVPVPFTSHPKTLIKLNKKNVNKKERDLLDYAKSIFDQMTDEIRFV